MTKFQSNPRNVPILKAVPGPGGETAGQAADDADMAQDAKQPGQGTDSAHKTGEARSGQPPLQKNLASLCYSEQSRRPVVTPPSAFQRAPARPGPVSPVGATAGAAAAPAPSGAAPSAPAPAQPGPQRPGPGPGPGAVAAPAATLTSPSTLAPTATIRPRHRGILASFVILVMLPVLLSAAYLWLVAKDQYASTLGFSVRTEEISSSLDLLGGITRLSGGGSSDSDILYDYIHSQELVQDLDAEIDLRGIYAQRWPEDPVFAFNPAGAIEDLVTHWERKVRITYDSSSGLMTLRVLAFTPEQAKLIAERILERSTEKINALAAEARADATRYARIEMNRALERLKEAREAMTRFRSRTQMVDPAADLQGQMGVLNTLQAQLAESYIELDLLHVTTNASDPRIIQAEQRIGVIRNRIEEERRKFSESESIPGGKDYATMVSEFERLSVDREFAEQAYRVALAAYDAALAEAQRKSRYLAAHIRPTKAETSEYPRRWTLLGLTGFFLFAAWAIGVLIFYSIRDRR